jgi:uncharacterized LabA/DUF88 family protein
MPTSSPHTCAVLIDGGNFYYKLKTLGITNQLQFDFSGFATSLAQGDVLVQKRYYVGAVSNKDKTAKSERLHRNQQRLLSALTTHGFTYALGYLLQDGAGVYHEKGVDVQIAIDIVSAAYEASCQRIFLVSSDTDLIPAIKLAKSKGLEVIYVGFRHEISYALRAVSSHYRLLRKEDVLPFVAPKP